MTLLVIQAPINPIPSIKLLGMQEVYVVGNEGLEQRALTMDCIRTITKRSCALLACHGFWA